ncbi:unnamed protein product [Caenorhabditis sp. 36 PRJEB53466]|nr:unnamed protein product [Caenorhabditis sp. 36 PRJEB53466]
MPRGVQRDPAADAPQPGCCDTFLELLRACGLICYVACPPVPSMITRKLAFHPPEKGVTYRIALKTEPEKRLKHIGQCKELDYQLVVRHMTTGAEYVHPDADVEVFSVRTAHRNELVCVRCIPNTYSNNPTVTDQVVLFCQPNSSDLGGFLQPHQMNFITYASVFETDLYAFDYSGYGFSTGTQGEKNVYADVRAVYQKIRETRPDKKIVLMGYSIGTTAAVDLAASNPDGLAGVVLVAPFTSGLRLFSAKPDKPATCWADSFTSYDKVGHIETRVLICHGDLDEVIPLAHGMALYERLKNPVPPSVIHGANHQTILSGKHIQVFTRIATFLRNETLVSCRTTEIESLSSPRRLSDG